VLDRLNDDPVADAGPDMDVRSGDAAQLDGSGSSEPNGDDLAYLWRQLEGPVVTLDAPTAVATSFVAPDTAGLASVMLRFELLVRDGAGAESTDAVHVRVLADADAPVFVSVPSEVATVGLPYAYDEDNQVTVAGLGPITYGALEAPQGFSIDPATGVVSWTPAQPGAVELTLTADNALGRGQQMFVVQAFEAPRITSTPEDTYSIGVPYQYDADGRPEAAGSAPIGWKLLDGPESMEIDPQTGAIAWLPSSTEPVAVSLEASNDHGQDTQHFTLARPSAEPPRIVTPANAAATVGIPYRFDADGHVDVSGLADGEVVELVATEAPPGFILHPHSFEVGWLPSVEGSVDITLALRTPSGHTLDRYAYTVDVAQRATEEPVAAIAVAPTLGDAPLAVTFDATGRQGVGETALVQYTWQSGDGALLRTAEPTTSYTYTRTGAYQATVEVLDATGATAQAKALVLVTDGGRIPPSAVIEADVLEGAPPLVVQLGCACADADGTIEATYWQIDDETTSDEPSLQHTFTKAGTYTLRLTVEDDDGLLGRDSVTVTVGSSEQWPPVARIVADTIDGNGPLQVDLRADVKDADGVVERITWTLPGGGESDSDQVRLVLDEPGYYDVSLQAIDDDGLMGQDAWTLKVRKDDLLPPRIISAPMQIARAGEVYRYDLDGRAAAQGSRPLTWSLGRVVDGNVVNVPAGMRIDGVSGELTWTPEEDQPGQQRVSLIVQNAAGSDLQEFIINVAPKVEQKDSHPVGARGMGCACANAAGAPAWLVLCAMALLLRKRKRHQDTQEAMTVR
jgi:PKD repeat protein